MYNGKLLIFKDKFKLKVIFKVMFIEEFYLLRVVFNFLGVCLFRGILIFFFRVRILLFFVIFLFSSFLVLVIWSLVLVIMYLRKRFEMFSLLRLILILVFRGKIDWYGILVK